MTLLSQETPSCQSVPLITIKLEVGGGRLLEETREVDEQ